MHKYSGTLESAIGVIDSHPRELIFYKSKLVIKINENILNAQKTLYICR